jgi:hypothetical protein
MRDPIVVRNSVAAGLLQVHTSTVIGLQRSGTLGRVQLAPRAVGVPRADLERYLRNLEDRAGRIRAALEAFDAEHGTADAVDGVASTDGEAVTEAAE